MRLGGMCSKFEERLLEYVVRVEEVQEAVEEAVDGV